MLTKLDAKQTVGSADGQCENSTLLQPSSETCNYFLIVSNYIIVHYCIRPLDSLSVYLVVFVHYSYL